MATTKRVEISAPNFQTGVFRIIGTAPYLQHKFSNRPKQEIKEKQMAGSTAKKNKQKVAKDFNACYEESKYVGTDGTNGIPATAFRNAFIRACKLVGYEMTMAKMSVFVEADTYDQDDGTPLVNFVKGKPKMHEGIVRIQQTMDLRVRAMWREGWEMDLRVKWDADQFTIDDISNLIMRAGLQVGVGEGRPFSKASAGCGFGTFELKGAK